MTNPQMLAGISSAAIERLHERERRTFLGNHPNSIHAAESSAAHWLNGVPMHWMTDWQLPVPLVIREALGAVIEDIDGNRYSDFCLGDTGAMFGHSPPAVAAAIRRQAGHGLTYM